MKILVLISFLITFNSCFAASTNIPVDIMSIDMDRSGNEISKENIKVFLNNEGKPKASMRFEVVYSSSPKMQNKLYIWAENVNYFRERLVGISEGKLAAEDFFTPVKFGVDKGMVRPTEANNKKYVSILTTEGVFLFNKEDIPKLVLLLEILEKATIPKK